MKRKEIKKQNGNKTVQKGQENQPPESGYSSVLQTHNEKDEWENIETRSLGSNDIDITSADIDNRD